MTATQAAAGAEPRLSLGPDDTPPDGAYMAAMLRAVRLAAKCFDIARSSKFAGERDAAISRGIAIAKKAKLRIELFDIPGSDGYDLQIALRDAGEALRQWADRLTLASDETVYDAKRRAFDEAARAAAERDRQSGRRTGPALDREAMRREALLDRWPLIDTVIRSLRARRVVVVPVDQSTTTTWSVSGRASGDLDEWQLRELADEVCA